MTLDTKALEAAALDFCKHLCTPLEVKEIWANKHRKQIYLNATESVLSTYLATRSQSLPDELKAIAERHKEDDQFFFPEPDVLVKLFDRANAWAHKDRAALLSYIKDIRRDTAREIADMVEQSEREDGRLGLATSIRSAYGVEG